MPNFIKARCVQCKDIVAEVATENVKKTPIILCLDCWNSVKFICDKEMKLLRFKSLQQYCKFVKPKN